MLFQLSFYHASTSAITHVQHASVKSEKATDPLKNPAQMPKSMRPYWTSHRCHKPMLILSLTTSPQRKRSRGFQKTSMTPAFLTETFQDGLLKFSTPKVGVSTHLRPGTPSFSLRSKKLPHSPTTTVHSASARPAYLALATPAPRGCRGPGTFDTIFDCSCKS